MKKNFKRSLKDVLIHEGGWADHPKDPGEATMQGITLATYRRYSGEPRTRDQLRKISDRELEDIYYSGYWAKCHCDRLPSGVDYVVFDAAVNSGPGRSARWLQATVGATQDGHVGPKTLSKVSQSDSIQVADVFCDRRLAFLRNLSTWPDFGKGWQRRVEAVRATAITLAGGYPALVANQVPSVAYRIVKQGSRGLWVRKVQQALGIHVDGKFGKNTNTALKAWQAEHGLEADGIAGRNTYRALGLLP